MGTVPSRQCIRQNGRGTLSRQLITQTAVDLIERHGVAKLTMRSVANQLGCGTMSLYTHVASRDDMVDAVVEHLIQQLDTAPVAGETWQQAARRVSRSYQELAGTFPRSFELLALAPDDDDTVAEHLLRLMGTLSSTGLTDEQARRLLVLLDAFATGFLMVAVRSRSPHRHATRRPAADALGDLRTDALFEQGVETVLAGFATTL